MTIRKLDKTEWRSFLDGMSKVLEGEQAEIEVVSLALGDQIEAEWLPFLGITYDPKDDVVEIALEGVDHLIEHPREIYVDDNVNGIISLEIADAEGTRQIVKFREPLALPAPA
jgi:Family of unknown function (DUF5335)